MTRKLYVFYNHAFLFYVVVADYSICICLVTLTKGHWCFLLYLLHLQTLANTNKQSIQTWRAMYSVILIHSVSSMC